MIQVKFNTQSQPFFQALRTRTDQYFKANKISTKGDSRLYWKTAILSITFIAIYITLVFLTPTSTWINLILCSLLGANFAAIGFNMMHDGAHGSYSGNKFLNESMGFTLNIMGGNLEYRAKPWFWSDQFDVKLQIAGLNSGFNDVVTRGANPSISFWYYKDTELLAVDAMNDPRAYMIGKRLIEAGRSPGKDLVKDTSADLKSLL